MPASEVKRDANALQLASSWHEDPEFREDCQAVLATNVGILKGQYLEGDPLAPPEARQALQVYWHFEGLLGMGGDGTKTFCWCISLALFPSVPSVQARQLFVKFWFLLQGRSQK